MCVGVTHPSESRLFRNVRQTPACPKCKALCSVHQKQPPSFLQLEHSIWVLAFSQYLEQLWTQRIGCSVRRRLTQSSEASWDVPQCCWPSGAAVMCRWWGYQIAAGWLLSAWAGNLQASAAAIPQYPLYPRQLAVSELQQAFFPPMWLWFMSFMLLSAIIVVFRCFLKS